MSMEVTSGVLPIPPIGLFDEESCRYFLREVGEQIVPFYPFTFGIDEVYTLLLERYGEDWVADALSVLHELMEGEDNANGLGDDGDIWRSWRHSWRHRNDDPSKPFKPTVRDFVLPPPTSQRTRRARAASFSAWIAAPLETSEELLDKPPSIFDTELGMENTSPQHALSNDGQSSLGRTVRVPESYSHFVEHNQCRLSLNEATRTNYATDLEKEEADSQQDFDEVRHFADSIDFDNSHLISFEMLTSSSGLRDGSGEVRMLRPVKTLQNRVESPLSVKHQKRISQSSSCQVSNLSERASRQKQDVLTKAASTSSTHDPFSSPDTSWSMNVQKTVSDNETTIAVGGRKQTDMIQSNPANNLHTHSESSSPGMPLTTRRTVANRHARLIDGAIFTVKHRGLVDPAFHRGAKLWDGEAKRPVVRASWSAVRQKEISRHSLIQSVRGIFCKDQQLRQQHLEDQNKGRRRTHSLSHNALDSGCDMLSPESTVASNTPGPSITPHVRAHSWGLDGSFDEESDLPRSSLNLNKALPASPGNIGIRNPSSSRTGTTSFDQSQDTPVRPSTASSVSSGISTASSKREFRALTRGLINEDMGARRSDLSPVREVETLSPTKYDPRESIQSSVYSENSYKGTRNHNPFIEDPSPLTPGNPRPLSVRKREYVTTSLEASQMSPSHSLPNVPAYAPSRSPAEQAGYRSKAPTLSNANAHEVKFEPDTEARGRTPHRPLSPSNARERPPTNTTPQKRSRSPVKKLLGQFGKSTSLKNIASEPRSKSHSTSPEKSTTTPLRSWGNRFRHGFLTMDSETEEQLNDTSTPPQRVSPSTPQASTFPISLDPPYQAKILSEIELMICYHANNFLMEQWRAGRLSDDSIAKIKYTWTARNRPQVLEFMYDQSTQRELIASNLRNVHFHGECGQNGQVLNATLYNWKSLATEMAVRTFCSADSAIRKYMHDSHKIIEMLGAPANTFLALQDLQIKTLAKIAKKQRNRMERSKEQETPSKQPGSVGRRVGTPAPIFGHTAKPSKGSIELNPSPGFGEAFESFENSRGGRLGMMVRNMVEEDRH